MQTKVLINHGGALYESKETDCNVVSMDSCVDYRLQTFGRNGNDAEQRLFVSSHRSLNLLFRIHNHGQAQVLQMVHIHFPCAELYQLYQPGGNLLLCDERRTVFHHQEVHSYNYLNDTTSNRKGANAPPIFLSSDSRNLTYKRVYNY